jgi:5'-methylthioadenosine phosphorylase
MRIGILCGHQINDLFDQSEKITVDTVYGMVNMVSGLIEDHQVFFVNRHGINANLPPHKVNYMANIQAFESSHVDCLFSIGTVGSMNKDIVPGDFVVPHDFFDATHLRSSSFFDNKRIHVDMTDPFCPTLRKQLIDTSKHSKDITIHPNGVYVTTEGPRLETASEIRFYATLGEMVGMTLVPEVVLAREKGLCFASLCIVCNMAAGLQTSLPVDEIKKVFEEKESYLTSILKQTIKTLIIKEDCSCTKKQKDALL